MGRLKGEQSMLREEGIRPFPMIGLATAAAGTLFLLTQDRAQAPPDEAVEPLEQAWPGVFEGNQTTPVTSG
jgi:hypothetical protein